MNWDRSKQGLRRLLGPGRRLMSRLQLPSKLGLLAGLMMLPVVLLLVQGLNHARGDLVALSGERSGIGATLQLYRFFDAVQALRLAAARSPEAHPAAAAELRAAREQLGAAIQAIDSGVADGGTLIPGDEWGRLRAAAQELVGKPLEARREAAVQRVGATALDAHRLLVVVAERSQLLFDPDPRSYFLMDIGTERLWALIDAIATATAAGTLVLERGEATVRERQMLAVLVERVEQQLAATEQRVEALVRSGARPPVSWVAATQGSRRVVNLLRGTVEGSVLTSHSEQFHAQGVDAIKQAQRAVAEVLDELSAQLDARSTQRYVELGWTLLALVLGLLATLYLAACFYAGFSESLRALREGVHRMAAGDLAGQVDVHGHDELAAMAGDLDRMVETLSALVAEIRSCSVRVDQAGADVAQDGRALAERTEMQAFGLRDAVQSVRKLSAAVASNATVVAELDGRTQSLGTQGSTCSEVMERSVQALQELDESVRRVAEINAVIDDIAFQTNLLSLNASVEAARAGEAGKGFGVVAAEVRALSQRCSEAAAEVRELIDRTAGHCSHSRDSVAEAQRLLQVLVGGVSIASTELKRVADVGHEQSQCLDAVSRSVSDLDNITRGNAKAVAAATQAAQALADQARVLRHSVAAIRLRQGGADEARAMVEAALLRIADLGLRHAAEEFNQAQGPFVDRDMHLCAVDADGRYLVHGAAPDLVGKQIFELSIMSHGMAEDYLERARAAAAAGGGWIDYQVLDASGQHGVGKSAYIAPLDDGAFLGCAVRRQGLEAEAAADAAAASSAHRPTAPRPAIAATPPAVEETDTAVAEPIVLAEEEAVAEPG